jgi:hypothetical protein
MALIFPRDDFLDRDRLFERRATLIHVDADKPRDRRAPQPFPANSAILLSWSSAWFYHHR